LCVLSTGRTTASGYGTLPRTQVRRTGEMGMAIGDRAVAVPVGIEAAAPTQEAAPHHEAVTLSSRRGRTILMAFTSAHFAHHVSNSILNPLLPFIRDSFALSYAQSGFLVSAFALSLGLSNAPIGALADRIGSRPVIVAGLVLTAAVSVALAFAGAYWQLLVLLVVMGLIAGSYHAPAAALIAQAFPARSRGAAMGFHIVGGHLSFFVAPLAAAAMIDAGGSWRSPYLWLAFAPLLAGVWVWFLAPKSRQRSAVPIDRFAVFREVVQVARLVGPLVSLSILFQMIYAALLAFTALYLVDARGVPAPIAAVLFGVPQLVGVLASPLGGSLSDRLGRHTVIVAGMALLGPSFVALTLVPNELLLLPFLGIGLAAALRMTVTEVLVLDSAPAHRRATVLGAYHLLAQHSGGLGAPLLGILAATLGIGTAYGGVSLALAALSVGALLFHRALRRGPSNPTSA
jgi:MFS family permease